jgi:hypothetical protein
MMIIFIVISREGILVFVTVDTYVCSFYIVIAEIINVLCASEGHCRVHPKGLEIQHIVRGYARCSSLQIWRLSDTDHAVILGQSGLDAPCLVSV